MTPIRLLFMGLVVAMLVGGGRWLPELQRYWHLRPLVAGVSADSEIRQLEPVECLPAGRRPFVVLALGQSNAGNHGAAASDAPVVKAFFGQGCVLASDPLPGSTGEGGSIWPLLPGAMRRSGMGNDMLVAAIGLDATRVSDWVSWPSPVRGHLVARLRAMRGAGLLPDAVLWQQGEADARAGTAPAAYAEDLVELRELLVKEGYAGPLFLGLSTVCRQPPSNELHGSMAGLIQRWPDHFQLGADTDSLDGPAWRRDGCHFTRRGLEEAARRWAQVLSNWWQRRSGESTRQQSAPKVHWDACKVPVASWMGCLAAWPPAALTIGPTS